MVTICQQCGDEGWSNAYVYCVKCLDFSVHRYCLDEIPENFDDFVQWFCEDCRARVTNQSIVQKPSFVPSQKREHTSSYCVELIHSRSKLKKKDFSCLETQAEKHRCQGGPCQQPHEADAELDCAQLTGDCVCLEVKLKKRKRVISSRVEAKEEKYQRSPSQKCLEACSKLGSSKDAQLSRDSSRLKVKLKKKNYIACSVAEAEEQRLGSSPSLQCCKSRTKIAFTKHAQLVSDSPLKTKPKKKGVTALVAETKEHRRQSCSAQQPHVVQTGFDSRNCAVILGDCSQVNEVTSTSLCSDNSRKELKVDKERRLVLHNASKLDKEVSHISDSSSSLEHDYHGCAPVIDPIWRGSFNICNKECHTFDRFVAHLSSKACQKVCEEASLFPPLLCLEMLPKAAVWPKSFEKSKPSDESIALYFFPDTRYECVFDDLVNEMMRQELAMRATVENAELLVFPSTELPKLYWKFQGKYYLWGVFKGKEASSPRPLNRCLMVSNRSNKGVVYSDSASAVGIGEGRNLAKAKSWDARSPHSPFEQPW